MTQVQTLTPKDTAWRDSVRCYTWYISRTVGRQTGGNIGERQMLTYCTNTVTKDHPNDSDTFKEAVICGIRIKAYYNRKVKCLLIRWSSYPSIVLR